MAQNRSTFWSGPLLTFAAVLCAMAPATATGQDLEESIQRLIERHKLEDAHIGYRIEDARNGAVLASRNADQQMLPASNMKVLTSGAALAVLGPDFSFRTTISRQGPVVTLVGDGDPSLGDPEILALSDPPLTIETLFETLAAATLAAQPGEVTSVRVDARIFDGELVHPTWEQADLFKHYAAQVSGLNVHTNNLSFFTAPDPGGSGRPKVTTQPDASWISLTNSARTNNSGTNTAWISRIPGQNDFTLHGTVVRRDPWPIKSPIDTPSLFAGRLLAAAIEQQGTDDHDLVQSVAALHVSDPAPEGGTVAVVATPLHEVLVRCNRDSQNLYAEALLKRIGREVTGRPGSWADGAAVVRMLVAERLGPAHASRVVIADGSGLSRGNLVAPDTLTAWLRSFYADERLSEPMLDSMATPGQGTFTRRFRNMTLDNEVRGKSGSLTGVRTLSGMVTHPVTGRTVAFAVFVSQSDTGSVAVNARDFADQVVGLIDQWITEEESAPAHGG